MKMPLSIVPHLLLRVNFKQEKNMNSFTDTQNVQKQQQHQHFCLRSDFLSYSIKKKKTTTTNALTAESCLQIKY